MDEREERRRAFLSGAGAAPAVRDELLAYGEALLAGRTPEDPAALADEPQVAAWLDYADAAAREGTVVALARVFPQLRFPVRAGISGTDVYRAATRLGRPPEPGHPEAPGLPFEDPGGIHLEVAASLAGRVPFLVAAHRADFEALVRALSARNEPVPVPPSMGACLVRGLPNWDRVGRARRAWEAAHPELDWDVGFAEMLPRRELYQDRFVLLSSGPYSGVEAADAGFEAEEWRRLSLAIRREHEATHYLTLRCAGTMRTNLLDELIADWAALQCVFRRYDARLALLFLGLEKWPVYRPGGRLENYRAGLSDAAFLLVQRLVFDAVAALAAGDAALAADEREGLGLARRVLRLAGCALDELSAGALPRFPGVRLAVHGDPDGVARAVGAFDDVVRELALEGSAAANVRLVLDEVLSNHLKYGWDGPPGHVEVRIERVGNALELEFVDDGRPFDVLASRDPDTSAALHQREAGGLGIYLVKRLTDEQRYEHREGRNRLLLRKRL